ncbi:TPA: SMI1/KNR4 family protein, partial [Listeria monocytogenes]|nr:SMI1/KNR4 family protein [Listeria monocytogenes]
MTIWVKNEKNGATEQVIREKEIALGVTLPFEY